MNKDIRIAVSFKGHRKRKRLRRLIGDKSDSYLIDLWLTVAMDCPSGVLDGWDEIDIADAVDWDGDPQIIVDALVDTKWIEKNKDGNYFIHDWIDHNGYASDADQRSDKSRFSRMAYTFPALYEKLKAAGYSAISSSEYKELTSEKKAKKAEKVNEKTTKINGVVNGVNDPLTNPLSPSPLPEPTPCPKSMHQKAMEEIESLYKTRTRARLDEILTCSKCGTQISAEDSKCPGCDEILELTEF